MIAFRYHLVSIVGIFLAFALGIAVGTAALNGAVTDGLRSQVNSLRDTRDTLRSENGDLRKTVDAQNEFAGMYGPSLLDGTLTDRTVVLIQTPGASDSQMDAIAANVQAAGGKVTARITLTSEYFDRARAGDIRSLATGSAHPAGLQLPSTDDAGQLGGALLSYVLVGTPTQTDVSQVVAGFAALQMVRVKGDAVEPADLAIVVTGGKFTSKDDPTVGMVSALAVQLDTRGKGAVVAGDLAAADEGGVIASIRSNAAANNIVSTVDGVDGAMGQLTAVLALAEQANGKTGHYGTGPGANAIAPEPAS